MRFQRIAGKLGDFVRGQKAFSRRRSSRSDTRLRFENLESRVLMSRQAIRWYTQAWNRASMSTWLSHLLIQGTTLKVLEEPVSVRGVTRRIAEPATHKSIFPQCCTRQRGGQSMA